MAYENRDYTHLSEAEKQKIELIAQAIRNKAYGIDVRESIALAIEWVNREYKLTIKNNTLTLKEFESAKSKVNALELDMDEFIQRYSEQIAGNTNLDETIDARVDATGVSHTTLKDRLDKEQQRVTAKLAQTENELDAKKLDKNRGAVTSADLSQEVKEQMTGGSVAVIGKNSVLEENIVDKQVTLPKLSPLVEKEIYIKTLLKNIVPDSYFRRAINTTWYALDKKSNDTITFENGVFTHKSSSLTDSSRVRLRASISLIAGHKYFISFEVKNNNSTNFTATNAIILSGSTQKHMTETSRELDGIDAPGVWHKKINSTNNYYVADGTETVLEFLSSLAPLGEGLSYRKPLLIDVTEAYGVGNEPSFEEFKNFISSYPNEWFEEYSSTLARTLGELSDVFTDENEEWRV